MAQQTSSAWRPGVLRRELRGIVLALLMVAATTVIAYGLIKYIGVRRGSVIYLIPVLLAGWHLGLIPSLVAAVAGVLWSGYFFFAPFYSYFLARPSEILNLALFMVVAVVTSHLANSMKKQTELARKRENEVSDLYAFSRRVAAAPVDAGHLPGDRGARRDAGAAQGRAVRHRRRRHRRGAPNRRRGS